MGAPPDARAPGPLGPLAELDLSLRALCSEGREFAARAVAPAGLDLDRLEAAARRLSPQVLRVQRSQTLIVLLGDLTLQAGATGEIVLSRVGSEAQARAVLRELDRALG